MGWNPYLSLSTLYMFRAGLPSIIRSLKTVCAALGIVMFSCCGVDGLEPYGFQPIHTTGRQQENMTIPRAAHIDFRLLMMGGRPARNM